MFVIARHSVLAGVSMKWILEVAEGIGVVVALLVAAILWFAQSSIESLIEVQRASKGKRS